MSDIPKLTLKQERFVAEYLIDLNATAAYKRAGYKGEGRSAENAASQLLGNLGVRQAIEAGHAKQQNRLEVTAERIIKEQARLAFSDVRRLYNADGCLKPIHELDDDAAAAISGVEVFEEFQGLGEDRKLVGFTRKVKLWSKTAELDRLEERYCKPIPKKVEISGPNGEPIRYESMTNEQLRAEAARVAGEIAATEANQADSPTAPGASGTPDVSD